MNLELCKKYKKNDCPYFEPNCPKSLDENGNLKNDNPLDCVCAKFLAFVDSKDKNIVSKKLAEMNVSGADKFEIMMGMQKVFAERFHKVDNLSKSEIDHWTNAYLVCIEDEIVEALEFINIFPIEIKSFDLKEYRKELIDIVHFLMDGMLVAGMTYNDLVKSYSDVVKEDLTGKDVLDFAVKHEKTYLDQIIEQDQHLYTLNYILRDIRLVRQCISWKHWKKANDTIDTSKLFEAYTNMFRNLILAMLAAGMTSEDIYQTYVGKNIENVLRQDYGYAGK